MTNIETGVDRLVQLIKDQKKISLTDAAKKLGVSKVVLQEWADFLQEEKVIDIDYKLTTTWLIEKRLSEEDIKKKKSDFDSLKDNFIRRAESTIESVGMETEGLEKIKDQFSKIKKEIGGELEKVQDEVKELENFENLKKGIDQEIINQQAEFRNSMTIAHQELLGEEKKYQNLIDNIEQEKDDIKRKEMDVLALQKKEQQLKSKLTDLKNMFEEIQDKIDDNQTKIEYTKEHIDNLEDSADKIERLVIKKRNIISPLLERSKEHEKKIIEIQNNLLQKVLEKKQAITNTADEGRQVVENFKKFFDKKAQVELLLMKIEEDKINLKTELNKLIKKAKMFDIVSSAKSSDKHVKELKLSMDAIEKKKEHFKNEVKKLLTLVQK